MGSIEKGVELLVADLLLWISTPLGLVLFALSGFLFMFLFTWEGGRTFLCALFLVGMGTFTFFYLTPAWPPLVQQLFLLAFYVLVAMLALAALGFAAYSSLVFLGDALLERWAARHGLPLSFSSGSTGAYRSLWSAYRLPPERLEIFSQLLEDRLEDCPLHRPEELLPLLRLAATL